MSIKLYIGVIARKESHCVN